MKYTVRGINKHYVEIPRKADSGSELEIPVGKHTYKVRVLETNSDGSLRTVMVNNCIYPVEVLRREDGFPGRVLLRGVSYPVDIEKVESTRYRPPMPPRQVSGEVRAELPGQLAAVLVEVGESVRKGQPIAVLEAMKMENEIRAPRDGEVKQLAVQAGKSVMRGDLIMEIV